MTKNKIPQITYRWDEDPHSNEVGGYFSNDPFAWHWLNPYGNGTERTLYMVDVRYKRKFPRDCGEKANGGHSCPWKQLVKWYAHEFIVKENLPAFRVGKDIERAIHFLDEYLDILYSHFDMSKDTWDEWRRINDMISKVWQERTVKVCEERYRLWRRNGTW